MFRWSFLYLLIFHSCVNENEILLIKFNNDETRIEMECLRDSTPNGTMTVYYGNTDAIKQVGHFINGVPDGYITEYYRDGKVKTRIKMSNGNQVGESLFFESDGELKRYSVRDLEGDIFFITNYDGLKAEHEGFTVSPQFRSNISPNNYVIGDTLIIDFYVINPPKSRRYVYVYKNNRIQKVLKMDSYRVRFTEVCSDTGIQEIKCINKVIWDEPLSNVLIDSFSSNYYVSMP